MGRETESAGGVLRRGLGSVFADRRLMARAGLALALANFRFWPTVAPHVRNQLRRWEHQARAIPDPALQELALGKLREESFNAEVAATLATLAPRAHRTRVVEAIVALEVMYDYLDGLTEQPVPEPLLNGQQLYHAFTDAITPHPPPHRDYYRYHPHPNDGGYLAELSSTVRDAIVQLPAANTIVKAAQRAAARCAEAQTRIHAAPRTGTLQLERWAASEAAGTGLGWREFLAGGAASVLCIHALIAAAADPRTTTRQAAEIDTTYLSICALSTILDSLIDHEHDTSTGSTGHLEYYENHDDLARSLTHVAEHAANHARSLPHAAHHTMTLVGVVAYYTSAPTARSQFAEPLTARLHQQLRPLITPTLAVMRSWRRAKQIRHRRVK